MKLIVKYNTSHLKVTSVVKKVKPINLLVHKNIKKMGKYDQSAQTGKELFLSFIKERMKEKKLTQKELAKKIGINENSLFKNLNDYSEISFITILKICEALDIRPFFIPKELDDTKYRLMFFN